MTADFAREFRTLPPMKRQRWTALSRILKLPLEAVEAWEWDLPRRAEVSAEWEEVKARAVPASDTGGRQAVSCCDGYGLSPDQVRAAHDRDLLMLYGMGVKHVAYLRRLLAARPEPVAPPLPAWLMEE